MHELTEKLRDYWGSGEDSQFPEEDKIITTWLKEKARMLDRQRFGFDGFGFDVDSKISPIMSILGIANESLEDKFNKHLQAISLSNNQDGMTVKTVARRMGEEAKQYFKQHPEELKEVVSSL